MKDPFKSVFPAIRGVQAGREYYVSMCPLRLIPKMFSFNEEELVPELRAQRTLNKNRLPEMSRYILNNQDNYIFSALTASIDSEVEFEPMGSGGESKRIGLLHVPMSAKFIINDGQHRRAAIELALRENPELGDESIAVVLFLDIGLKRCQQMFSDLNRYSIRPSKSLGVLYDHREEKSEIARRVSFGSSAFRDVVEMERSTLSARSRRLFTLSAIYSATSVLLSNIEVDTIEKKVEKAVAFWNEVSLHIPEWRLVMDRKITAGDVRRDFIHSHGVVLQAIGRVGNAMLRDGLKGWRQKLKKLNTIDWSRSNAGLWEGRAMIGGRVSKSHHNVILTCNAIKSHIGLSLTEEEERVEQALIRGESGGQED